MKPLPGTTYQRLGCRKTPGVIDRRPARRRQCSFPGARPSGVGTQPTGSRHRQSHLSRRQLHICIATSCVLSSSWKVEHTWSRRKDGSDRTESARSVQCRNPGSRWYQMAQLACELSRLNRARMLSQDAQLQHRGCATCVRASLTSPGLSK